MALTIEQEAKLLSRGKVPLKICLTCQGEMKNVHRLKIYCSWKCQDKSPHRKRRTS